MKNLMYTVNAEMEAALQAKRQNLQQKLQNFNQYQTQSDILAFTKQQKQEAATINQPQKHEKQRGILNMQSLLEATSTPLIIPPKTPPQEDSSDIEISEAEKPQRTTLIQELEYLKNRSLMEREDADFADKLALKTLKTSLHSEFLKQNKYKICYGLMEEMLEQVVGVLDVQKIQDSYNVKKGELEEIYPLFSDNLICEQFQNESLESYLKQGRIIGTGGNDPFEFQDFINSELNLLIAQNAKLEINISIQNQLLAPQIIQGDGSVIQPKITLYSHEESLNIDEDSIMNIVGDINFFSFKTINNSEISALKENFIVFNDSIKKAQIELKIKNRTSQVPITLNETLMIIPTISDSDKFLKTATNEQILQARINFLIYKINGLENYFVFEMLNQSQFNTSKAENSNVIVTKESEIEIENQINIYYPVKVAKQLSEVENQFQFIVTAFIKFTQIFNSPNQSSLSNKPKSAGSTDPLKTAFDANLKSKFQQISISNFSDICFLTKEDYYKLEIRVQQQQKGKKTETDQTETIMQQWQQKSVFQAAEFSEIKVDQIVDESVIALQTMYKQAQTIMLNFYSSNSFKNLTTLEIDSLDLSSFTQLTGNLKSDFESLKNKCQLLPSIIFRSNIEINSIQKILQPSLKAIIIKQLTNKFYDKIRIEQKSILFNIQLLFRTLSLKTLILRKNSIFQILNQFDISMSKISDEIDGQLNFSSQKQTKIENFVHEMRENFVEQLDEIFAKNCVIQSIFEEKTMTENCEFDVSGDILKLEQFLVKYWLDDNLVEIFTNNDYHVYFNDLVVQQLAIKIDQLLNISFLPFLFYDFLRQIFDIQNNTQDSLSFKTDQLVNFDSELQRKLLSVNEFTEEQIEEIFVDISSKFCLIQESNSLKTEISEIVLILQKEIENGVDRSVKLSQRLYLLTLQAINQSCKESNQTEFFLQKCKESQEILAEEQIFIQDIYSDLRDQLNIEIDLSHIQSIFKPILPLKTCFIEIQESDLDLIFHSSNLVNQELLAEKLALNEPETIRVLSDLLVIKKIQNFQISDPNPKAKKGATILQQKHTFYDAPFVRQIASLKIQINLAQFEQILSLFKELLTLSTFQRPQSAPKQSKQQEIEVKVQPELIIFGEQQQYFKMLELSENAPKIIESKQHTREFLRLYIQKFAEMTVFAEQAKNVVFLMLLLLPGIGFEAKCELIFDLQTKKVVQMALFGQQISEILALDFSGQFQSGQGEQIEVFGVQTLFLAEEIKEQVQEKLMGVTGTEIDIVEVAVVQKSSRAGSAKNKK
ncbi:hypothetical protein SS50377_22000 [Spironucleus salmonicida]|uniref:Uncharacterized protein n=1 Tax=Spironucleus salmonicida TaxID=348837 RepID=V6LMH3_9EUKA|nr:hypothetical protein SS50377_22000 [Spironucleus salmonicida]|eukprot:EST45835.1 Hypothetical protein SS50377_14410 [Spironucleus salmonicida]